MSKTSLENAYILALRGIPVPAAASAPDLRKMVGTPTPDEEEELGRWAERVSMNERDVGYWRFDGKTKDGQAAKITPGAAIVARALAMRTGHQCLIPIGMLKGPASLPDASLRLLLAYYARRGYPCLPLPAVLTSEQQKYADLGLIPSSAEPSRVVINAGPGTGKTTTAVELVRQAVKAGKTVLVLAYTNSAVTTLRKRLGADPYLGGQYKAEPFASKNEKTTTAAKVLLSTVDQMAGAILAGHTRSGGRAVSQNFDKIIDDALTIVLNNPGKLGVFEAAGAALFNHIIVDEAQMLSESRGALIRAIARGLETSGINGRRSCHLTVFCDPKQRISPNTGQWLVELYKAGASHERTPGKHPVVDLDGEGWELGALTQSFRFETAEMLEFVMKVSRKRPALHVDLAPGLDLCPPDPRLPTARAHLMSSLETVAMEIREAYVSTKSVAILSPSIGRTNAVSRQVAALILELRRLKVPICMHGEDNYQAHGVMVVTYNSCAGMEFRHVFILGAAGYPKNYPQVSPEVARSLVFIANSRASRSVCYILDKPEMCVDIDESMVKPPFDMATPLESFTLPDRYSPRVPEAWTAETMFRDGPEQGGSLYMVTNGIRPSLCMVDRERSSDGGAPLYETVAEFGRPPCLRLADVKIACGREINPGAAHLRGIATRGRITVDAGGRPLTDRDGVPYVLTSPPPPPDGSPIPDREAFYWYCNLKYEPAGNDGPGRAKRLRAAIDILLSRLAGSTTDPNPRACKHMMRRPRNASSDSPAECFALCPDLMFSLPEKREGFVCFSNNVFQTLLVGAALWLNNGGHPLMVHVDAAQGTAVAYDGFHEAMAYQLDALRRIHVYTQTTIFRQNYLGVPAEKRPAPNLFSIDTEHVSGRGGVELYEIGILNMEDPYRSFCRPIVSANVTVAQLARMGLDTAAYAKIATVSDDLLISFMEVASRPSLGGRPARVLYYSAPADIKWLESSGVVTIDLAERAKKRTPGRGTFETDSRAANLDALYGMYVGPIDTSGRHQAFPDAVSLAEVACAMMMED
jgi:hypothetical protein